MTWPRRSPRSPRSRCARRGHDVAWDNYRETCRRCTALDPTHELDYRPASEPRPRLRFAIDEDRLAALRRELDDRSAVLLLMAARLGHRRGEVYRYTPTATARARAASGGTRVTRDADGVTLLVEVTGEVEPPRHHARARRLRELRERLRVGL